MSPAPIHPTERFVVGASDTHTTTTTTITILGIVWAHIHIYTHPHAATKPRHVAKYIQQEMCHHQRVAGPRGFHGCQGAVAEAPLLNHASTAHGSAAAKNLRQQQRWRIHQRRFLWLQLGWRLSGAVGGAGELWWTGSESAPAAAAAAQCSPGRRQQVCPLQYTPGGAARSARVQRQ